MKLAELYAEFKATGFNRLSSQMTAMQSISQKTATAMAAVGKVAKYAFAATGGIIIGTTMAASRFEKELNFVSTMLQGTAMRWMPAYEKGLEDLSTALGESTATLSRGLYDILSASVAPAKALKVLEVASKAAVGGLTDTATSADAITTILNSYKMSADDAAKISDKLFATVLRGKLTYAELAGSIGMVSATASIAGVGLDELLASVSTITRGGVNAHVAMTSVMGVLKTFLKPTEDAKELAASLGLELSTAALKADGLAGVFKKLAGLRAEDLAKLFPNIRGLRGVAIAMQDQAGFTKDLAVQANAAGMAEEAFAKMAKGVSYELGKLKQTIISSAVVLGKAFSPMIVSATKAIRGLMNAWRDLHPNIQAAVASFIKWTFIISGTVLAVKLLIATMKLFSFVLVVTKIALLAMHAVFLLISTPIAVIIAAIGALGVVLLKETGAGGKAVDWLREKFSGLAKDVKLAVKGIGNALATGDIGLAAEILWSTLEVWWTKGILKLTNLWVAFRNGFADILASLGPIILNIGGKIVDSMLALGTNAAKALASGLLHGPAINRMKSDAAKAKAEISYATGMTTRRMIKDVESGKIKREDANKFIADLTKRNEAASANIDKEVADKIAKMTGISVGDELKKIWKTPLPPLDTTKFENSLKGIGLTPEQQARVDKAMAAVKKAIETRDDKIATAAQKAGNWGPRSTGGTGWDMPIDALDAAKKILDKLPDAVAAAGAAGAGGANTITTKKGKFVGFEDIWRNLQSAVLGGGDEGLKIQKDQLVVQNNMLKELKKPKVAVAGP